jgi:radical SAM superfamily enzyme YgiQ (UPF0313 family)
MKTLLLSLPVPEIVPGPQRGNHQLFAEFTAALARVRGLSDLSIGTLPRTVLDRWHDEALAREILSYAPDAVGLSLYVWNADRAFHLARLLSGSGITLIAGGPEAESICGTRDGTDEAPFEFVVTGEGEETMLGLLGALTESRNRDRDGAGSSNGDSTPHRRTATLRGGPVEFTRFAEEYCRTTEEYRYDRLGYLELERGCPFSCSYCSYAKGRKTVTTMPDELFDRCAGLMFEKPIEELYLLAPTLNRSPRTFRERLGRLAALQERSGRLVRLFGEVRPELLTEQDIALMRRAGFLEAEIGIQSLTPGTLRHLGRGAPHDKHPEGPLGIAERMLETGIRPILDFILGLPGDDVRNVLATIETLETRGLLQYASFYRLQVLPGTGMRETYLCEGWRFQTEPPYFTLENDVWTDGLIRDVYEYLETAKDHSYYEELSPRVPGGVCTLRAPGDEERLLSSPYLHTVSLTGTGAYPEERLLQTLERYFSAHPEVFHRAYLSFTPAEPGSAVLPETVERLVRRAEAVMRRFPNGYDRYRVPAPTDAAPERDPKTETVRSKRAEALLPPDTPEHVVRRLAECGIEIGFLASDEAEAKRFGPVFERFDAELGLPAYLGETLEEIRV